MKIFRKSEVKDERKQEQSIESNGESNGDSITVFKEERRRKADIPVKGKNTNSSKYRS
jgi:hypothetical protein